MAFVFQVYRFNSSLFHLFVIFNILDSLSTFPFRLVNTVLNTSCNIYPDSKVHGADMGPNWVLSAPDRPPVGPWTLLSGYFLPFCFSFMLHHVTSPKLYCCSISTITVHKQIDFLSCWKEYIGLHNIHNHIHIISTPCLGYTGSMP